MPTLKKRMNIILGSDLEYALAGLAKRDNVSESAKAVELLRAAIELEEDTILAEIAHKRMVASKGKRRLTHKEVWG